MKLLLPSRFSIIFLFYLFSSANGKFLMFYSSSICGFSSQNNLEPQHHCRSSKSICRDDKRHEFYFHTWKSLSAESILVIYLSLVQIRNYLRCYAFVSSLSICFPLFSLFHRFWVSWNFQFFFWWIIALTRVVKNNLFQSKASLRNISNKRDFLLICCWAVTDATPKFKLKTCRFNYSRSFIEARTFHLFPLQKFEQKWAGIINICKRFTRSRRAPSFVNHRAMCFFNDFSALNVSVWFFQNVTYIENISYVRPFVAVVSRYHPETERKRSEQEDEIVCRKSQHNNIIINDDAYLLSTHNLPQLNVITLMTLFVCFQIYPADLQLLPLKFKGLKK